MADENHTMNDQSIDRALREALDVSPSPDFVARVRTRIANEPASRSVWSRWAVWTPVAAGALAAAIALAVWVAKPAREVRLPAPSVAEGKPDTTAATNVPRQPVPTVRLKPDTTIVTKIPVVSAFPSLALGTSRRTVVARKEPEILISQSESAALRRLIARASEAQIVVNDSPLSASDSGPDPSAAVQPLPEIQPLKIDPIVPVDGQEGVRQ
jgi:hypothetical protein